MVVRAFAAHPGESTCLTELALPDALSSADTPHAAFESLGIEGSVYTALRTFGGERFLALEAHLDRTERSMRMSGWPDAGGYLDRALLRRALQEVVLGRDGESTTRVDVLPPGTRVPGVEPDSHHVLTVGPYQPVPAKFLAEGVRVELARELSRERPEIKTAEFVLRRRPYPLGKQEAYEHLMLDPEERILEATSANVYFVERGELRTAAAGGVLAGITLGLLLQIAEREGIPVRREAISLTELERMDEALLTSSTRGVVPIVNVAGQRIGDGRPGPVTTRLREALATESARIAQRAWPPPDLAATTP